MKFHVPEMSCGHCKASIEGTLAALDPASVVVVKLDDRIVEVETTVSEAQVIRALSEIGFETTAAQ